MAKLLLYGEIGWEISAKDVVSWIDEHKNEAIEIHVNSPGGDVFEAIAIRSAILDCEDVTIVVDSMAASAAAIISLCGKPLKMAEYSRLMIHSACSYAQGNSKQMQGQIEMLNSIDADLAGMIAGKMGKSVDEILEEYFDGNDHWITQEECVEMGIAEKCEPTKKTENRLVAVYDCINGKTEKLTNKIITDMDITKIQSVAAFKDCTTEDEVVEKANAQAEELANKEAEIAEKDEKIADLEAKVAEYEQKEAEAQAQADENIITDAVKSGKIKEEQADVYRALMKSDRENTVKMIGMIEAPSEPAKVKDFIKGDGHNAEGGKSLFVQELERIANKK